MSCSSLHDLTKFSGFQVSQLCGCPASKETAEGPHPMQPVVKAMLGSCAAVGLPIVKIQKSKRFRSGLCPMLARESLQGLAK